MARICLLLLFVTDWLQLGNQQFERHQFQDARASYLRATSEQPGNASGWKSLGLAELELKNYQAAYEAWLRADKLNPRDGRTKYLIGRLFFEADLPNEAASWLRQSLSLQPHDYAAMTYLGLSAEALGLDDTAAGLFRNAIYESNLQKKPYSWSYLGLAKLQMKRGDNKEAMRTLEEGSVRAPEAHVLATYGDLLLQVHETKPAEEALRHSIALDASLSQPHYRLALLLKSEGHDEESRAEMERFQKAKADEAANAKVMAIRREPAPDK